MAGVALVSTSAGEVASGGLPGTLLSRHNPLTRDCRAARPAAADAGRDRAPGARATSSGRSPAASPTATATSRPWLVDLVDTMISANAVDALIDFVDTVGSHDRVAALPALATCEVLVAAGDADRVIPVTPQRADRRRAARRRRWSGSPGVGHLPMLEQPAAMDEALVDLHPPQRRPRPSAPVPVAAHDDRRWTLDVELAAARACRHRGARRAAGRRARRRATWSCCPARWRGQDRAGPRASPAGSGWPARSPRRRS